MSWTSERVDLLKKLWLDGLSASQIAAELGGVTRNAVIGKVHRLGLSGRAKAPAAPAKARKTTRPANGDAQPSAPTETGGSAPQAVGGPRSSRLPSAPANGRSVIRRRTISTSAATPPNRACPTARTIAALPISPPTTVVATAIPRPADLHHSGKRKRQRPAWITRAFVVSVTRSRRRIAPPAPDHQEAAANWSLKA
jgi:hypothetical protein